MSRTSTPGRRPLVTALKRSLERRAVGVIGGDTACLRSVVHYWTGRAPSNVLPKDISVVRLPDADNRRDLIFIFEPAVSLDPWPGGPLIWMYPERGPSAGSCNAT